MINTDETIDAQALMDALPNRQTRLTPHYRVEYGMRYDDGVLVMQFFPPEGGWDPEFRMDERLTGAIAATFPKRVIGDFIEEVDSFCLRVTGMDAAPSPMAGAKLFFDVLDSAL